MPVDFSSMEEAWLQGSARFEKWRERDEAVFFRPLMQTMISMHYRMVQQRMAAMTPEIRAAFQADPAYPRYLEFVKGVLGKLPEEVKR